MAESVGERLRMVRGGMSQDDFAVKLAVHKETIGKYERDKVIPGGDVLSRLHETFGVNINWLLTGKGDKGIDAIVKTEDGRQLAVEFKSYRIDIDPILYGRVTEAVAAVYKELGYAVVLHQVAAEAARIATELTGMEFTEEERPGVIKGAMAALRSRLRESLSHPDGEAAGKHPA